MLVVGLSLLFAGAASATVGSLDQSNPAPSPNSNLSVTSTQWMAQTFTVGAAGSLTDVDVTVSTSGAPNAPLDIAITRVASGSPDTAQVVASGSIAAASLTGSPQTTTFQLPTPVAVAVGEQYAIELTTTSTRSMFAGGSYSWWFDSGFNYASGSAFYSTNGGSTWTDGGWDLGFATYVTAPSSTAAAPVPAPQPPDRAGYCSVAGNHWQDGQPISIGTFLNLDYGQPATDSHYADAQPAIFVEGTGITCDPPPAGDTQRGTFGIYPSYAR